MHTDITWCKACLYAMTDSSKSLRRADVSFVTHCDALHVNGNSNLDFSSEEHFRLDLCKQREPRCIRRRGDTLGPALSARVASVWSMHIKASSCERGLRENWLVQIERPNNSIGILIYSGWMHNQKKKMSQGSRWKYSGPFGCQTNVMRRSLFNHDQPWGQPLFKLTLFFFSLLCFFCLRFRNPHIFLFIYPA